MHQCGDDDDDDGLPRGKPGDAKDDVKDEFRGTRKPKKGGQSFSDVGGDFSDEEDIIDDLVEAALSPKAGAK